jgi:cob(I)alamin adenosyltransferase
MLYTGKGDTGNTRIFGCDQRISKSSIIAESLGSLDETNSLLGLCKMHARNTNIAVDGSHFTDILEDAQQKMFIVQAEVAGADKHLDAEDIERLEHIIDTIDSELPEIKSFFVSGGSELSATLDYARTVARRAERRVVEVSEEGKAKVEKLTLKYLNRLSSLLYAMARYTNFKLGIAEEKPTYE